MLFLLNDYLSDAGIEVRHAREGDADVLVISTAIELAVQRNVLVIADDTDILILLCYHAALTRIDNIWLDRGQDRKQRRLLVENCVLVFFSFMQYLVVTRLAQSLEWAK